VQSSAYGSAATPVGISPIRFPRAFLNYDPLVTAHELGTTAAPGHTHDYGLDNCGEVPRRRSAARS
jgi:hypothetical protein